MTRAQRSPLSEEVKAELARVLPRDCDRRVLAALLPRAGHLGAPARRVTHGHTNASVNADSANLARAAAAARVRAARLDTTTWVVRQRLRRVTEAAAR